MGVEQNVYRSIVKPGTFLRANQDQGKGKDGFLKMSPSTMTHRE